MDEDFYIPTPVSGSVTISEEEISDLEYFRKKLFDALKKTEEKNDQENNNPE